MRAQGIGCGSPTFPQLCRVKTPIRFAALRSRIPISFLRPLQRNISAQPACRSSTRPQNRPRIFPLIQKQIERTGKGFERLKALPVHRVLIDMQFDGDRPQIKFASIFGEIVFRTSRRNIPPCADVLTKHCYVATALAANAQLAGSYARSINSQLDRQPFDKSAIEAAQVPRCRRLLEYRAQRGIVAIEMLGPTVVLRNTP